MTGADVAALIDHTLLAADATAAAIDALCDEAVRWGFSTVCVNPAWVARAAARLAATPVIVCTVAGFPLGATTRAAKRAEAEQAIADGAREVDMVIHLGALKSGMHDVVREDLDEVLGACRRNGVLGKVIIETSLLTHDEKVAACTMAADAGADFVKTSTGFGRGGANVDDVRLMRRVVGPRVGVKASGGIRTLAALMAMAEAGATRIGTSAGVAILRELAAPAS